MLDQIGWTEPKWPLEWSLPFAGGLTVVTIVGLLVLG